ncbi:MAG TPA: ABC transporter ATP-binding protein [Thermodesulfobacteriota bacterium]|nr:ABC transporter ATP-binding protein [Thermodesulfobacteriota bacterium]
MEVLSIDNVSKKFGGFQVLRDILVCLEEGRRLAVIGPNGAGKTTLINVISGVLKPSSGRVFLFGKDVTQLPSYLRSRLGLSRTFQILSLFPSLTVRESLLLSVMPVRSNQLSLLRPVKTYKHLFDTSQKLMEQMGLWGKRDVIVSNLSHGEQKLVEMAMSLSQGPKIMLLDEPMAGLSPGETSLISSAIRALPPNVSIILVEHNVDAALELSERVVVLNQGMILAEGSPDEIRREPKVREVYLGTEESKKAWRNVRSKTG